MPLITTTVSVDSQRDDYDQVTLNLVQGDSGTRRFLFVPTSGGVPISMSGVAAAKVSAVMSGSYNPMLIDCVIENGKIYMTPTVSLVQYDETEYECQLVLLDSSQQTLTSMKFTIYVHGRLYDGDAVEHTNTNVTSISWNGDTLSFALHKADDTTLYSPALTHTHPDATTEAKGFMTTSQVTSLNTLNSRVNQDLRSSNTSGPTFYKLTVGSVVIAHDGTVTGLKFS